MCSHVKGKRYWAEIGKIQEFFFAHTQYIDVYKKLMDGSIINKIHNKKNYKKKIKMTRQIGNSRSKTNWLF